MRSPQLTPVSKLILNNVLLTRRLSVRPETAQEIWNVDAAKQQEQIDEVIFVELSQLMGTTVSSQILFQRKVREKGKNYLNSNSKPVQKLKTAIMWAVVWRYYSWMIVAQHIKLYRCLPLELLLPIPGKKMFI